MSAKERIGFEWIESRLQLRPVQPLRVSSSIGPARSSRESDDWRLETYPASYRPDPSIVGHLEFGLKHEDINLEWLSRLFAVIEPRLLEDWIRRVPAGAYARRAGFLYEWLTARTLDLPVVKGNFVDAIDADKYFTRTTPSKNRRWRINDNLPGTPACCPLIRLTDTLQQAIALDVPQALADLDQQYGANLLMRSATWLTFNESRASFQLEREVDRKNDIRRFAAVLGTHCGSIDEPLGASALATIQREILGDRALRTGLRRSPVFIGRGAHFDATHVMYIAPHWDDCPALLAGLKTFEENTRPAMSSASASLIRAAAIAFAFVYIHPMADGNGRIHRFLINDTLSRDGVTPPGVVLPVSSAIAGSSLNRGEYDKTLDAISMPMMRRYTVDYRMGPPILREDGVTSELEFDQYKDALHLWRYPDLTQHVRYIAAMIAQTIMVDMPEEAAFLARHDEAMRRLKRTWEMPDVDAERIVRSLRENQGTITNLLRREYAIVFKDPRAAQEVVEAVMSALADRAPEPGAA